MKKIVIEIIKKQMGAIDIIDPEKTANELLDLFSVSVSLPSKDEAVGEGYRIAKYEDYNYRRVLKETDHDIYYSGWMDCFDWISKGNER